RHGASTPTSWERRSCRRARNCSSDRWSPALLRRGPRRRHSVALTRRAAWRLRAAHHGLDRAPSCRAHAPGAEVRHDGERRSSCLIDTVWLRVLGLSFPSPFSWLAYSDTRATLDPLPGLQSRVAITGSAGTRVRHSSDTRSALPLGSASPCQT